MLRILYQLPLAIVWILACSCHHQGGQQVGHLHVSAPSSRVIERAKSKPKDYHRMPVYTFGEKKRLVRTTAYTCSEWDHLKYGSRNAAGTPLLYGKRVRSAAADWSFYPVGTTFRIKGMSPLYVVDDYGSALVGCGTLDLYKPDKHRMKEWGRRNVEIEILEWGSFRRSAEILSKRTRHHHCRRMLDNILRLNPSLRSMVKH